MHALTGKVTEVRKAGPAGRRGVVEVDPEQSRESKEGAVGSTRAEPRPGLLGESWRAWVVLSVGVLAVSAHSALSFGITPLMRSITEDLGWTRSQYATALNFRIFLLMLAAPVAGAVVDRFGARAVLTLGALAMGVGAIVMADAHTLGDLYRASVLIGPAQACIGSVAGSALVLRRFQRHRGLAIGILNGGDNVLTSGVHYGAAALLAVVGWRGALGAMAGVYGVLALLFVFVLAKGDGRAGGEETSSPATPFRIPWRDRRFYLIILCYALIYAFITSVGLHFPAFQQDAGRSPTAAAAIYGTSTMVGALGSVVVGSFTERMAAARALLFVVAGLVITSLALWIPMPDWGFWVWAVFYGVANAGSVALLALVLDEAFGSNGIGRLLGTAMVFCMGATILGNQLSAFVFDSTGSYLPVWRLYSVLMVLALVPAALLARAGLRPRAGPV